MTDDVVGKLVRRFAIWIVTAGVAILFGAGVIAAKTDARITTLEQTTMTKVDAAELQGEMKLLRNDLTFFVDELRRQRKP